MVGTHLDLDGVLDLCQDQHRRIVLGVLAAQQRPLTRNDLTKAILKHNHHVPVTAGSGETATGIETTLHHVHLPKLEAAGLVEYDIERHLVEPTAQFDRIEPHLTTILDADADLDPPLDL